MELSEIIDRIKLKHEKTGFILNAPATPEEIRTAETKIRFQLPADFHEFYSICNGFECKEDDFSFLHLKHIFFDSDFGKDCAIFADHKTYTIVWVLRKLEADQYEIFCSEDEETILTNSLAEFLEIFLRGEVFGKGSTRL